mmetsp:Transcript_16876/g.47034  ORF Transcript_16876/g.47034 Transcript_16876/m.47034 type:complete len:140 (-) Transcript_16876:833-1252(-)
MRRASAHVHDDGKKLILSIGVHGRFGRVRQFQLKREGDPRPNGHVETIPSLCDTAGESKGNTGTSCCRARIIHGCHSSHYGESAQHSHSRKLLEALELLDVLEAFQMEGQNIREALDADALFCFLQRAACVTEELVVVA